MRVAYPYYFCLLFLSLPLLSFSEGGGERYELKGTKYPLQLFPILDRLNVPQAFANKHYLRFLFKCVFFEGSCDIIGKWLKPRAMAALFGTCLVCTDFQRSKMQDWLGDLIDKNPALFRAAMVKVCYDLQFNIDPQDFQLIKPFLKKKKK